jgi:hypothetical protein
MVSFTFTFAFTILPNSTFRAPGSDTDTSRLTQLQVAKFQSYAILNDLKKLNSNILKGATDFSLLELKCRVTKMAEGHCCCGRSYSRDLRFGFKLDSVLCAYMSDGLPVRKFHLPHPFRNVTVFLP